MDRWSRSRKRMDGNSVQFARLNDQLLDVPLRRASGLEHFFLPMRFNAKGTGCQC